MSDDAAAASEWEWNKSTGDRSPATSPGLACAFGASVSGPSAPTAVGRRNCESGTAAVMSLVVVDPGLVVLLEAGPSPASEDGVCP